MKLTFSRIAPLVFAATLGITTPLTTLAATQDAAAQPAQPAQSAPVSIGLLETQLRHSAPDSKEFGIATSKYWAAIQAEKDFPRAYDFFDSLNSASSTPNATLLASKASAAGSYVGWLYEHNAQDQLGESAIHKLMSTSIAEYQQAMALEPDNFIVVYGYAVFEGYRPGGQDHQKELLAKLDTLRTSKPYLPWGLVDQLEKTGRPN